MPSRRAKFRVALVTRPSWSPAQIKSDGSCSGSRSFPAWKPLCAAPGSGAARILQDMLLQAHHDNRVTGVRGARGPQGGNVTMPACTSRREFVRQAAALAAVSCFPVPALPARELLYPPTDLSYFDTP